MDSNHSQEVISSIKEDPGFNLGNPDKMIQGYRLYDLRHCSEIDIMFICAHKGKDFNPSRIDQFLSMLADDFGYNGIIDQKEVCQNAHLLFLCTKPRLSQAGALLLPKDIVSLSIQFILCQRYIFALTIPTKPCFSLKELMRILQRTIRCAWLTLWLRV